MPCAGGRARQKHAYAYERQLGGGEGDRLCQGGAEGREGEGREGRERRGEERRGRDQKPGECKAQIPDRVMRWARKLLFVEDRGKATDRGREASGHEGHAGIRISGQRENLGKSRKIKICTAERCNHQGSAAERIRSTDHHVISVTT